MEKNQSTKEKDFFKIKDRINKKKSNILNFI
jgi:hypothetical protein